MKWIEAEGIWKYVDERGNVSATLEDLSPEYKETLEVNLNLVYTLIGLDPEEGRNRTEEALEAIHQQFSAQLPKKCSQVGADRV